MEKTFRELRLEELKNLPIHPDYEAIEGLPIPLGCSYIVKECPQEEYKTKGGIVLPHGERLDHAKIGIVYNKSENCILPVREGQVVAFDIMCRFGLKHKGENYISVPEHMLYMIVPPDTFLETRFKDFNEKRREKRIKGAEAVAKRDENELDKHTEIRKAEVTGSKIFPVSKNTKI